MQYFYTTRSLKYRLAAWIWQRKWQVLLFTTGVYFLCASTYIHAKAVLAQWLIEDAWQTSIEQRQPVAPWSWADTYPVAKLIIKGKPLYVLAGVSGRVLAFGPGHLDHSPLPGEPGNAVISGHRDTHFAVLQDLKPGELIDTQTQNKHSRYQVIGSRIVHQSQLQVIQNQHQSQLTLITCYPFDNPLPDTPWRFVVSARLI